MGQLTRLLAVGVHLPGAGGPPVTPDPDTARQWLEHELAKPEYHDGPTLLDRIIDWLNRLFSNTPEITISRVWAAVLIVAIVAAVVTVAFVVAGPIRRRAAVTGAGTVLADDDERSAVELRRDADEAAAAGNWALAVIERFRAIARSLEERVVLDERPGRTADEFAAEATPRFEGIGDDLDGAARLFDAVCYGSRPAGPDDDARLRALDARLAATRPLPANGPTTTAVPA